MLQPKLHNPKHVDDVLHDLGLGWYHRFYQITAVILWSAEGSQIALVTLLDDMRVVASAYVAQFLCGLALLRFAHRFGPQRLAIATSVLLFAGTLASIRAWSIGAQCGAQALIGFGLAGAHSACVAASDWSPPTERALIWRRCPAIARCVGSTLAYAGAASWLALKLRGSPWVGAYLVMATLALICLLGLLLVLRESPKSLLHAGRGSEADDFVRALADDYGLPNALEDFDALSLDPKRRRQARDLDSLYSEEPSTPLFSLSLDDILLVDDTVDGSSSLLYEDFTNRPQLFALFVANFYFGATYMATAAFISALLSPSALLYPALAAVAAAEIVGIGAFELSARRRDVFAAYFLVAAFAFAAFSIEATVSSKYNTLIIVVAALCRASLGSESAADAALPSLALPTVLLAQTRIICRITMGLGILVASLLAYASFSGPATLFYLQLASAAGAATSYAVHRDPSLEELRSDQRRLLRNAGFSFLPPTPNASSCGGNASTFTPPALETSGSTRDLSPSTHSVNLVVAPGGAFAVGNPEVCPHAFTRL